MEPKTKGFNLRSLFLRDDPPNTQALAAAKSTNEEQYIHTGPGKASQLSIERITLLRLAPDIGQWRAALSIAESKSNPDRRLLYQVYREIEIDSHVVSVTQRLKLRCTNNPIVWRPTTKTQATPPALDAIITAPWFTDLIEYIIEAKWWGHSLIQLNAVSPGYTPDTMPGVELIARPNVRPEFGDILRAPGRTTDTIPFRTPPYTNFLLECGKPHDLGIFNAIAPNVLFKRYGVKDWAEFLEVYGMPLRKAEYDPNQPGQRAELERIMRDMGSNAGIIIPRGSTMELIDSAKAGNSQAFDLYASYHNAEISKAMLLQTMTTSDGSSLSQAEVHQRAEDEAVMGYRLYVLRYLNSTFKAILQRHGIPVDGHFAYDNRERLSLSQMADVVVKLQNVADIPMSWIYETFGIPAPVPGDVIKSNQAVSSQQPDLATTEEKKKLTLSLPDYPPTHGHLQLSLSEGALTGIEEELLRRIYTDQVATGRIDRTYFFALSRQLTDAVTEGLLAAEWSSTQPSDYRTLLEANVARFSAAKTLALVQQLNAAKNTASNFAEFRQAVAPLLSNYNAAWLRTEYNHAVAAATMGAAWRQAYAQRTERGYWQYVTAGDDRVRPAHAALDGMIFSLDDPETARLWPPNDFGCRCDSITLAHNPRRAPATIDQAVAAIGGDTWARITSKGWDTNWGQQAIVYHRSMEYIAHFAPNSLSASSWGLQPITPKGTMPKGGGQLPAAGLTDHRAVTIPLAPGVALPASVTPRAAIDTLSAPAEVWLQEAAGQLLRIYLRPYQGGAVVITVAVSPTAPETIVSITFTAAPEGLRAGILSYIK